MEWGEKSYLGPAEIESFVYCFHKNLGESKGSISPSSLYGSGVDQGS